MAIPLAKGAIDLGIVVRDGDAALRFYRDTLGLEYVAAMPMPTSVMHRLMCGQTVVKIVVPEKPPTPAAAPGGPQGATGIRYWTISVTDLDRLVRDCEAAGYRVPMSPREIRPGVRIAMVEDPEGNWVEFLEGA